MRFFKRKPNKEGDKRIVKRFLFSSLTLNGITEKRRWVRIVQQYEHVDNEILIIPVEDSRVKFVYKWVDKEFFYNESDLV